MMDPEMISAIVNVIKYSNMLDLDLITVEEWPITVEINEQGKETHSVEHHYTVSMGDAYKSRLSEAWVAANILLFTAYDGYLENKYNLKEGDTFHNRCKKLPQNTLLEIIEKDCYRIMKLIRNAIQHNLSSVENNHGAISISYTYKKKHFSLDISSLAIRYLYTVILNIINNNISDIDKKHKTEGHYMGILNSMYDRVLAGVTRFTDDLPGNLIGPTHSGIKYDADHLRMSVRYTVLNPVILSDNDTDVIFKHIENNGTDDENDISYQYSTDYVYGEYLLPQELGVITRENSGDFMEWKAKATIKFMKRDITDWWRMREEKAR